MKQLLPEPVQSLLSPSPAWLLLVAALGSTSRLAGAPWITGVLAAGAIIWMIAIKEFQPTRAGWPLLCSLTIALLTSTVSWLLFRGPLLTSYPVFALSWLLVALAVLWTPNKVRQLQGLLVGFTLGLLLTYAIGVFEVITGFKISLALHPDSATAERVSGSRFLAQSVFVNTNDFAIALVMLIAVLGARAVFDAGRGGLQVLRLLIMLSAAVMCIGSGSRGATLALGLVVVALAVLYLRQSQIKTDRRLVAAFLIGMPLVLVTLWLSPWVQDTSTASREHIAYNIYQLLISNPAHAAVGFASPTNYASFATERFGQILMDPHNLGIELVLAYGGIGLAAFVVCLMTLLWQGLISGWMPRYSLAYASITMLATTPVIGIVPSSFLPYSYLWIGLISLSGWVALSASRPDLVLRKNQ